MDQPKAKQVCCRSELEAGVAYTARQMAEREAGRMPWPRLQYAREKYVKWEAFVLWVRAIEEPEGCAPARLSKAVGKHCPDFPKFKLKQPQAVNLSLAASPVPKNLIQFQSDILLATDSSSNFTFAAQLDVLPPQDFLQFDGFGDYVEVRFELN